MIFYCWKSVTSFDHLKNVIKGKKTFSNSMTINVFINISHFKLRWERLKNIKSNIFQNFIQLLMKWICYIKWRVKRTKENRIEIKNRISLNKWTFFIDILVLTYSIEYIIFWFLIELPINGHQSKFVRHFSLFLQLICFLK